MATRPAPPTSTPPQARDVDGRRLAAWKTRHPWLLAVAVGLAGTVLTAFGVGYAQARGLDVLEASYAQAAFVALSALLGLVVMWRTKPSLADYGFRRPRSLDRALWLLPLAALPVILVAFSGPHVTPPQALAYAALAVTVGFNEEIWFRGLLLAALRGLGEKKAVIGGAAVFGALHLTNVFTGSPPLHLALQFAFACLAGLVLAELVAVTGSLWIGVAWHLVYDLAAWCTGEELSPAALVGLGLMTAILAAYAAWLWRHLPGRGRESMAG